MLQGRRQGFMPEYVEHPVKDRASWEEQVKWRLNPVTARATRTSRPAWPRRKPPRPRGEMIVVTLIGGYMYLCAASSGRRNCCTFYDQPALIDDCM